MSPAPRLPAGLSREDAADELGIGFQALRNRVDRGRVSLRALLA